MHAQGQVSAGGASKTMGPSDSLEFARDLRLHLNLDVPHLYEQALRRGEATIVNGGALVAETGVHTGRSPKDKFIVADPLTQNAVWWENNQRLEKAKFDLLLCDFLAHARQRELFAQDLYGAPTPRFGSRCASSPNSPGILCSFRIFSFDRRRMSSRRSRRS